MKNLIEIISYDERWPSEFRRVGALLRTAMGEMAVRIDHIGSTSVPGLAAKDVIDIQATVAILDREAISTALTTLGYAIVPGIDSDHIPPGRQDSAEEWRKYIFRGPVGERRINLHVRQVGRANQRYALLFRDYLRADPSVLTTYGQIKAALARLHPNDFDAYYDVKDPVCDIIMAAAERWALATNYAPGPSDL